MGVALVFGLPPYVRRIDEDGMDVLAGMKLFARVVETGGFSAVAREQGGTAFC